MELILVVGHEHDPALNPGAVPSYCILPLFHPAVQQGQVTFNSINGESVITYFPIHAHFIQVMSLEMGTRFLAKIRLRCVELAQQVRGERTLGPFASRSQRLIYMTIWLKPRTLYRKYTDNSVPYENNKLITLRVANRVNYEAQFKTNDSGFKDTGYHLFFGRGMFPFR